MQKKKPLLNGMLFITHGSGVIGDRNFPLVSTGADAHAGLSGEGQRQTSALRLTVGNGRRYRQRVELTLTTAPWRLGVPVHLGPLGCKTSAA